MSGRLFHPGLGQQFVSPLCRPAVDQLDARPASRKRGEAIRVTEILADRIGDTALDREASSWISSHGASCRRSLYPGARSIVGSPWCDTYVHARRRSIPVVIIEGGLEDCHRSQPERENDGSPGARHQGDQRPRAFRAVRNPRRCDVRQCTLERCSTTESERRQRHASPSFGPVP
jgi:hypothetical protein